jgi:D-alanyl-D-alanine endopeptidase (penicillin-binding protein 7)
MKRTFLVFLCLLVAAMPVASLQAQESSTSTAVATTKPYIPVPDEFASALVVRAATGKVLYEFKPDKPHTAASLSKMVMGITVLDETPNWTAAVTMRQEDEVGGGRLRVNVGDKVTFAALWQTALGSSANNAATAIARVVGPGVPAFVKKMNAKVQAIGATHSVFYDPSGMNPRNETTARDMAVIAKYAFDQSRVQRAAQTGSYHFSLANGTQSRLVSNTNAPFLEDPDVWLTGGKTGYLPESGYNYAGVLRPLYPNGVYDQKKEVVVVVLGSPTKAASFASVKRLAEWAWSDPQHFVDPKPIFTRSLVYGSVGEDVRQLQELLKRDPDVYPEGLVTGRFLPLTHAAVKRFQVKHGVAKPGVVGYGVVGPATRAKIAELYSY